MHRVFKASLTPQALENGTVLVVGERCFFLDARPSYSMYNVGKERPIQHLLFPPKPKRVALYRDRQIEHLLDIGKFVLKSFVTEADYYKERDDAERREPF
jgi:hypothetical protein